MMFTSRRESNPDAAYWQERYEDERAATERRQDEEARARKERLEEARRTASDWPSAFNKQRYLYGQELRECQRDAAQYPGEDIQSMIASWEKSLAALEKAERLWAQAQADINAYAAQKREDLAAAIEDEDGCLAEYLRNDDPSGWLSW